MNGNHVSVLRRPLGDQWLVSFADLLTLLLCFFLVIISLQGPQQTESSQGVSLITESCIADLLRESASGTRFAATKQKDANASEAPHLDGVCRGFLEVLQNHRLSTVELSTRSCGFSEDEDKRVAELVGGLEVLMANLEVQISSSKIWLPQVSCEGASGGKGLEIGLRRS